MSRTIRTYNPIIKHNSNLTDVPFLDILKKILGNTRENNLRKFEGGNPTILNSHFNDFGKLNQIGISIWKYRDNYKPFVGELNSNQLSPINRTLVEVTNFLYDAISNCLCFEYNKEGSSEKDLEKYINTFLPDGYSLELKKIFDELELEDIYKSSKIRSLEIKLNLSSNESHIIKEGFEKDSTLKDFFGGIVNASQNLGNGIDANFAYWKVDLGRGRGTFELEGFRNIIEALNFDSEKIESIKVKIDRQNKISEYDLKNIGKHYTFRILEDSTLLTPTPGYVLDTLQLTYDQNHSENLLLPNRRHRLIRHFFNYELLNYIPKIDNKVELENK